jgi:hypothetical protein
MALQINLVIDDAHLAKAMMHIKGRGCTLEMLRS